MSERSVVEAVLRDWLIKSVFALIAANAALGAGAWWIISSSLKELRLSYDNRVKELDDNHKLNVKALETRFVDESNAAAEKIRQSMQDEHKKAIENIQAAMEQATRPTYLSELRDKTATNLGALMAKVDDFDTLTQSLPMLAQKAKAAADQAASDSQKALDAATVVQKSLGSDALVTLNKIKDLLEGGANPIANYIATTEKLEADLPPETRARIKQLLAAVKVYQIPYPTATSKKEYVLETTLLNVRLESTIGSKLRVAGKIYSSGIDSGVKPQETYPHMFHSILAEGYPK